MNTQGYVQMVLRVTPEAKHRLKIHAVTKGVSMNSLVERAVDEIILREVKECRADTAAAEQH
jgi:predicted HicB family RNase H-like nuclease